MRILIHTQRRADVVALQAMLALHLFGCSGAKSTAGTGEAPPTGGMTSVGTLPVTGGSSTLGGTTAANSELATGGTTPAAAGGVSATGASAATGGAGPTGGSRSATGGTLALGGTSAFGGSVSSGGTAASHAGTSAHTGGGSNVGGTTAAKSTTGGISTGGTTHTGGTLATGGSPTSGGTQATGGKSATSTSSSGSRAITIWMAGDSTMMNCSNSVCPCGWGSQLGSYFNGNVTVTNSAVGGRSIQTWLYEAAVTSTVGSDGECVLSSTTYDARWTNMLASIDAHRRDHLQREYGG